MDDAFNGRRICVRRGNGTYEMWRASDSAVAAFARDPYADANTLADALAETAELYNWDDHPVWLNAGKRVSVNRNVLPEIISQHIAIKQPHNAGTADEPNWVSEYVPYVAPEKILRALLTADRREGGLLPRLTKV